MNDWPERHSGLRKRSLGPLEIISERDDRKDLPVPCLVQMSPKIAHVGNTERQLNAETVIIVKFLSATRLINYH